MLQNLQLIPTDPLFENFAQFCADERAEKTNLGVGIFLDDRGENFVLPSVRDAAAKIPTKNFSYLPMRGHPQFLENCEKFFFGKISGEFAAQQSAGGSHALRIGGDLFFRAGARKILVGAPTWINHFGIFSKFKFEEFPHLKNGEINFSEYQKKISAADENSILLLQGGASHNPIGKNFSKTQLENLLEILRDKKIFVFVDFAYFGFGEKIKKDREWLQILAKNLENLAVAFSFSKNASLYKQRVGALFIKTRAKNLVESNLQNLMRQQISNPPAFGAEIMNFIFENSFEKWTAEVDDLQQKLVDRRQKLCAAVGEKFSEIKKTAGMFALLPISPEKINWLQKKFAIYLPDSGRINFGGVAPEKIDFLAKKFLEVL